MKITDKKHARTVAPLQQRMLDVYEKIEDAQAQLYEQRFIVKDSHIEVQEISIKQSYGPSQENADQFTPIVIHRTYLSTKKIPKVSILEIIMGRIHGICNFLLCIVFVVLQLLDTWVILPSSIALTLGKIGCLIFLGRSVFHFVRSGKLQDFWEH